VNIAVKFAVENQRTECEKASIIFSELIFDHWWRFLPFFLLDFRA